MEGNVLTPTSGTLRNSTRPKLRLVALSSPGGFSGLPDAVLRELAGYCQVASVIDGLRIPWCDRFWAAVRTVRPKRTDWGRQYYAALSRYVKTPRTLSTRIQRCERELAKLEGHYDLIYQFGALFGVLKRISQAPLVLHIDFTTRLAEEYYPGWLPKTRSETEEWNLLEEEIYKSADVILAATDLVAASLSQHYHVTSRKIAVVGMGAHIEDMAADFVKAQNHRVAFAGPDFKRHGGEIALQIFEGIRRLCRDATMVTMTNRFVEAPNVHNAGIVSRARLHEIFKESAVLLMPGPVGGYQTVTEAMASKCLCVVSEGNPHLSGLIKKDENGLTFKTGSLKEVSAAIAEYLQTPDRLLAVGERARRHVAEECNWPRIVARAWNELQTRLGCQQTCAGPVDEALVQGAP